MWPPTSPHWLRIRILALVTSKLYLIHFYMQHLLRLRNHRTSKMPPCISLFSRCVFMVFGQRKKNQRCHQPQTILWVPVSCIKLYWLKIIFKDLKDKWHENKLICLIISLISLCDFPNLLSIKTNVSIHGILSSICTLKIKLLELIAFIWNDEVCKMHIVPDFRITLL